MITPNDLPLTPQEVAEKSPITIPVGVIRIFNQLIRENWDHKTMSATVLQESAVHRIAADLEVSRTHIFSKKWLDVEPLYKEAGWHVEYHKPAIGEDFETHFIFTSKEKVDTKTVIDMEE